MIHSISLLMIPRMMIGVGEAARRPSLQGEQRHGAARRLVRPVSTTMDAASMPRTRLATLGVTSSRSGHAPESRGARVRSQGSPGTLVGRSAALSWRVAVSDISGNWSVRIYERSLSLTYCNTYT